MGFPNIWSKEETKANANAKQIDRLEKSRQ
ncbi:hypothetical protein CCACVL1_07456 [Corchorus capsularis]|uniref:Uncharacterized protein n=1 Tax=Corchorus capsularis TaxID=210143 RepID=A0A1R3J5X1_COCAP|nr:hypothetical protein CCACVL1_07456 [Corchorus capsularis]